MRRRPFFHLMRENQLLVAISYFLANPVFWGLSISGSYKVITILQQYHYELILELVFVLCPVNEAGNGIDLR